ncbi:hypothetical protein AB0A05_27010 [Streptomyces sp. NPDC046374]|uniref:hypothetical protein n=1 Tax=Streptomyces sp. NPDC046374 TaxID=3154917 RepID=UPI0033EC7DDD
MANVFRLQTFAVTPASGDRFLEESLRLELTASPHPVLDQPGAANRLSHCEVELSVRLGVWAAEEPEQLANIFEPWLERMRQVAARPPLVLDGWTEIAGAALRQWMRVTVHRVQQVEVGLLDTVVEEPDVELLREIGVPEHEIVPTARVVVLRAVALPRENGHIYATFLTHEAPPADEVSATQGA